MNITKDDVSDIEEDQISHWMKQPSISTTFYLEPKLQESTVEVVKLVCDVLQQTDEVFVTAVDVLEKYVHITNLQAVAAPNSLVILTCGVLMSSKLIGSYPDIKIRAMQRILLKLGREEVDKQTIKKTELDMLLVLGTLPLTSTVTDLCMFLEYYIKNLKLRVDIQPLCLEILNVFYISRKRIFNQLKSVYVQNSDAVHVFKQLNCNKFYYIGGIILCALMMTKCKNFLSIRLVVEDIEKIAVIHYDHLQLLADAIYEVVNA